MIYSLANRYFMSNFLMVVDWSLKPAVTSFGEGVELTSCIFIPINH